MTDKHDGPGATGEFPEGKLIPSDEGELRIALHTFKGKVVMQFGKEVAWFAMPPGLARAIAQALIQEAEKIERGMDYAPHAH